MPSLKESLKNITSSRSTNYSTFSNINNTTNPSTQNGKQVKEGNKNKSSFINKYFSKNSPQPTTRVILVKSKLSSDIDNTIETAKECGKKIKDLPDGLIFQSKTEIVKAKEMINDIIQSRLIAKITYCEDLLSTIESYVNNKVELDTLKCNSEKLIKAIINHLTSMKQGAQ